ncbi:hypothetical protein DEU56DRAFT_929170 [Suillus clintonianus]|uniref:uncharacterized protein n=1 Tax=Suillus clintonianus TaxID=1904413 RepID=UPI001B86C692|nr:uncharacterized protein DEU56DRAFT_919938 [Suillus clintonianus]XP_041211701.1 uncharacterized protein DEU56DRAFT_929170 [Suillus clintonianus]KAG2111841.1 hypothetical protein DEU56DRAFT_919938 [Suillus clintonianus]KAG2147522.1 hypothetical protein DEU56DRAFT_929170 [Suillus clintonianus]
MSVFDPHTKHSNPLPLPEAVSDPTAAGETAANPRGKTRQLLQRFKKNVTEQISRFISRGPTQNLNHEGAPLTPNIENTPSGVKEGVVPKLAVAQVQGVPSVVKESVDAVLQAADKAAVNMKTHSPMEVQSRSAAGSEVVQIGSHRYFHRAPKRSNTSQANLAAPVAGGYRGGTRKGLDLTFGGPVCTQA